MVYGEGWKVYRSELRMCVLLLPRKFGERLGGDF